MTATSTTTPQLNDLISSMKKNNRAARAARFLVQCFDVVWLTTTWNFLVWGSDDNPVVVKTSNTDRARSIKSFILCLYMKTTRAKHCSESALLLFCTTWPTWNNRKRLNLTKSSFLMWRFRCSCRRNSLMMAMTTTGECNNMHWYLKTWLLFFDLIWLALPISWVNFPSPRFDAGFPDIAHVRAFLVQVSVYCILWRAVACFTVIFFYLFTAFVYFYHRQCKSASCGCK